MPTSGAETNVPLLVAGVFAATFLVVGALAYLILFRQSPLDAPSRMVEPPPESVTAGTTHPDSRPTPDAPSQSALPLEDEEHAPALADDPTISGREAAATPMPPAPSAESGEPYEHGASNQGLVVRLYRALMFATGVAGLLASALMFSAVEGLTLLPLVAILIAAFSVYSIYRGFVPDRELTQQSRTPRT